MYPGWTVDAGVEALVIILHEGGLAAAVALAERHGQQALALQTIERLDPRAF